jgi:TetR/AcrR family tetracycline transcriptional repressor
MQRRNRVGLAMLPASKYPRLIECAAPMTNCDEPDFHYGFGIGLFIDGVKAAAARISGQATGDTRSG